MKIKWKTPDVPTGRYSSFHRRGWPYANFVGGKMDGRSAISLICKDEYVPANVKTGNHAPIFIFVAVYNPPDEVKTKGALTWKRYKTPCATLKEAKEQALKLILDNAGFYPET